MPDRPVRVGLFITCLVDLFRPTVGFAAVRLLEEAGCIVVVTPGQTCCGQPGYNSGDRAAAAAIARQVVRAFADVDYVVAPSGSCAGMLRHHYPDLLADDPQLGAAARDLAARSFELLSFLTGVMGITSVRAEYEGVVTYHDSCSGLRELGVKDQPRRLLQSVDGVRLVEMATPEVCCGFGGTFCVKYPAISDRIVTEKALDIAGTGADTVLAGDLGCLLNIAGKLSRLGKPVKVRHVAEVLAGMTEDVPPIGAPAERD